MPALNLMESNDKIIEIHHHMVPQNTHHYNDWINPRDFLNTLLHFHPGASSGSPSSASMASSSSGSPGHNSHHHSQSSHGSLHGHNETHFGNTTPGLPGHPGHGPGGSADVEQESVIVVYALILPLLATLIFILIVALYVRRMRRTSSLQDVGPGKGYEFSLEEIKVHSGPNSSSSNGSHKSKKSRFSRKNNKQSTKENSLNRSVSSVNISSSHNNKLSKKDSKSVYNNYYDPEPYRIYKRQNSTGFLNSSFSLEEEGESSHRVDGGSRDVVINPSASAPTFPVSYNSTNSLTPEDVSHSSLRHTYSSSAESTISATSTSSNSSRKGIKVIGGKIINAINIPKKIKQHSMEKKRFNIYTIPMETREQLKQIYVY